MSGQDPYPPSQQPAPAPAGPAWATSVPPTPLPPSTFGAVPPGPPAPRTPTPAWVLPVVTGVVGFVLGLGVSGGIALVHAGLTARAHSAVLSEAVEACDLTDATGIELGDDDQSLTFDGKGEEDVSGASIEDVACLLAELDVPSSVSSHIDQTTSLDGRQAESWGDVTLSWTYHPDRGLDGVLTVTK